MDELANKKKAEPAFTATQIANEIIAAQKLPKEPALLLQHRVRYLAKKGHLQGGKKIDERGTLEFPKLEVFRAALFCELLAASMDIKTVRSVLQQAQSIQRITGEHPESARVPGGWTYRDGGLGTAFRGVESGEDWTLVMRLRRPGRKDDGGFKAYFTWSGETQFPDVDHMFGRQPIALSITVDINALFQPLIDTIETP